MDARLWELLAELHQKDGLRCVVWRGNGKSFSSGRDTSELGVRTEDITDLEFIERGHAGTQQFFTMPCPIVVALKGWVIGGSFERALLCDMRIAGESARMRLPEVLHGVVPDSGGTARLFQMAGHGLVADLALTGRVMDAQEALAPRRRLARRARREARRDLPRDRPRDREGARLHREDVPPHARAAWRTRRCSARSRKRRVTQSMVFASRDYAEMKAARAEKREPKYRGR